jgi:hypothetical protein
MDGTCSYDVKTDILGITTWEGKKANFPCSKGKTTVNIKSYPEFAKGSLDFVCPSNFNRQVTHRDGTGTSTYSGNCTYKTGVPGCPICPSCPKKSYTAVIVLSILLALAVFAFFMLLGYRRRK